jgi:serine/threonine protein kinase
MDLLGQTLGQYQLIEVIHQGENMVYKGFQPEQNRYVAVKILPPARARDPVFVQQFRKDMELIRSLKQPNILPIYTYGQQQGLLFLVTPYIKTGPLHERLPEYYTPARAPQIVSPVAGALTYIHSRGAIHGNLKPANILIGAQRQPLLADLGFSQGLDLGGRDEAYLSPEQLQDGLVDRSTDIYALGALLYRMVVGETPPVGGGGSPRLKRPDLPVDVEQVILRAMAQYPEQRFQSAGELSQALDTAVALPPVVAQPIAPAPAAQPAAAPTPASSTSNYWLPLLLGVAVVCLLGVVCAGALAFAGLGSQDSTESPVILPVFFGDPTATPGPPPAEVPNPTVQAPVDQPIQEAIVEPLEPESTEEPPTAEPTQEPSTPEPTQEQPTSEPPPEEPPDGSEGG